jgi:hypothetical protein
MPPSVRVKKTSGLLGLPGQQPAVIYRYLAPAKARVIRLRAPPTPQQGFGLTGPLGSQGSR